MKIVICPGIHDSSLTREFLAGLQTCIALPASLVWVFPAERYPAYSGLHVIQFIDRQMDVTGVAPARPFPLIWIGFSAGVVGAVTAAGLWRLRGETVAGLFALDGWGVPLAGDFPIHRVSHDSFTHWTSAWLGAGQDSFYADPPVTHLDLWRSPQTARGWWRSVGNGQTAIAVTAAEFIATLLQRYGVS